MVHSAESGACRALLPIEDMQQAQGALVPYFDCKACVGVCSRWHPPPLAFDGTRAMRENGEVDAIVLYERVGEHEERPAPVSVVVHERELDKFENRLHGVEEFRKTFNYVARDKQKISGAVVSDTRNKFPKYLKHFKKMREN